MMHFSLLFGQTTTIMHWISQMCFTLLILTLFCQVSLEAKENKLLTTQGDRKVQRVDCLGSECFWNCTYKLNRTDGFVREHRVPQAIFDDGRLFRVNVTYEIEHDDKWTEYTKQAFKISSSVVKGNKQWRVRLNRPTNEEGPSFVQNALKDLAAFLEREFFFSIEASCTFQFGSNLTSATNQTKISVFFPDYFKQNILQITGLERRGKVCDEEKENLQNQSCITITDFEADGWTQSLLWLAIFCFVAIFSYISPCVVCLFPATEVTSITKCVSVNRVIAEDGDRQIIVAWHSPVGFRSLIGNFFFCRDDTMWHRARRFIMRVFILPAPFFLPALFVEYLQCNSILPRYNFLNISHLFSSFKVFSYCCYCLQAFLCSFSIRKPCTDGWQGRLKRFLLICDLPLQMLIHLRRIWSHIPSKPKDVKKGITKVLAGPTVFQNICISVCCLCLSPLLLIFIIGLFFMTIWTTFPIAVVCSTEYFRFWVKPYKWLRDDGFLFTFTLRSAILLPSVFLISWFATHGGLLVLRSAGLGILLFLQVTVKILFCKDNLPLVTAFAFLAQSLWSSYSSFTKRYKTLALALCKHYEEVAGVDWALPDVFSKLCGFRAHNPHNVKRIPKTLFDKTCEELMPIKENFYNLIWKIFLYLNFFCAVVVLVMLFDATSYTKTLVVGFMSAVPKVMTFFLGKRNPSKPDDMAIDEKVLHLVQQYTKRTPNLKKENDKWDDELAPSLLEHPEKEFDEIFDFGMSHSSFYLSFSVILVYTGFEFFNYSSW